MTASGRYGQWVRLFSSSLANQALLSATSLLIGVIMVRRTADAQYGYYVLASNALLLMASLQASFFGQPLVSRLTHAGASDRGLIIGSFYHGQRGVLRSLAAISAVVTLALWLFGFLDIHTGPLVLVMIAASLATLDREYFRMVLLSFRRPQDVLRSDIAYVVVLFLVIIVATLTPVPALIGIGGLGVASILGSLILARTLRRQENWKLHAVPGLLREIATVGLWSCAGAAIHWGFSQGYGYLVVGTLGVPALAAVAATRMLMQPVNLLSIGLTALMLPLATAWLRDHGPRFVLRRLAAISIGLAALACGYFAVLWEMRDWVFDRLLHKAFAHRDQLMLLWSAAFAVMVIRDQLIFLLIARARFRILAALTAVAATLSLGTSYLCLKRWGDIGAPLGVLIGEIISVAGIIVLSLRELHKVDPIIQQPPASDADTPSASAFETEVIRTSSFED